MPDPTPAHTTVAEWVAQQRQPHIRPRFPHQPHLHGIIVNMMPVSSHVSDKMQELNATKRFPVEPSAAMRNQLVAECAALCAALSDRTRLAMLIDLMRGERTVGDLAAPHDMSRAAAAKHVAVLDRSGLIERRKVDRRVLCRVRSGTLAQVVAYLGAIVRAIPVDPPAPPDGGFQRAGRAPICPSTP